ncbi:MAG: hypothetical protein KF699_02830 [Phycisphaeraceae bacterium]|nr:hypothetical protein [Phycisphaeraceae bacterium]MBX3406731.1 hypothetical protein [Phycisphaeraceae bacterium]
MVRRMSVWGALACSALVAGHAAGQMTPISATGWNRDVVIENTATAPFGDYAQPFDTFNNWAWYERNLPGSTKGLPVGGTFVSLVDATRVQFQPYNQNNALFLDVPNPTGTLTFAPADQREYETIAIFASSSNQGGLGTMVITFTDSTTHGPVNFNAQDWFNVTTNNALNNLGRANTVSSTIDDGSAGNPRIYQTTLNLGALGLNTRRIESIAFTKPNVGGANQNTVVMAISGLPAITQLDPLAVTGFNRDIVVENTATPPYANFAESFDLINNLCLYETGLPGSIKGLPAGGMFFSESNAAIVGQLAPYDQPNALLLTSIIPAATLTLDPGDQRPYDLLAVFASTSSGGGLGSLVIHFTDSTSSDPIAFNAQDWFFVTTSNAMSNLGRLNLNTDAIDDGSAGNPRIYQSVLNLSGLGLNNRAVQSITFTRPATGATAIFGISGQEVSGPVGACVLADGSCYISGEGSCAGTFMGEGSSCPATGACIAANGDCTIRTSANCSFIGGTWQGASTTCPAPGACIAANGGCTQLNSFQCAFQGGTFLGGACPAAGACIAANGDCTQLNSFQCAFQGGTFLGGACPQTGACCVGGNCVALNSFQCAFQNGTFEGAGTNCTAGPAVGANSPGLFIADSATVSDSIVVTSTTPLSSVFLVMNINHTWIGDVSVTLTFFPDGGGQIGPIDVFNRPRRFSNAGFGVSSDLTGTADYIFGDGGADLWAALAPNPAVVPHGFYSPSTNDGSATSPPNGAFTSFAPFANISPAGVWTISISDGAPGDTGTLNTWSINGSPCEDEETCPADWDGNNTVEVADIFAFLSSWFANDPAAQNFGGSMGVGAIFAFLSAWFAHGVGPC